MIFSLADPAAADHRLTGGKAATLARLKQAGFAVPEGICLPAGDDIRNSGGALTADAIDALLAAYRGLGSPLVAVRSSAVEEDGLVHSFSGVYETQLNVRGEDALLDAVSRCYAAYDTPSARAYRDRAGIGGTNGLALLVMPMIDARAAGALFTADPASRRLGRMVISATFGLAEPLVSGGIDADQFVVRRSDRSIVERHLGAKERRLTTGAGGEVAGSGEGFSVSDEDVTHIVTLALEVESALGGVPQDIEWVLDRDGALWVLQSRPVTTMVPEHYNRRLELWRDHTDAGEDEHTTWTRAYSDDVWTRPTSPLFYTIHNLTGAFTEYFRVVGHSDPLPVAAFRYHKATAYLDTRYLEAQAEYQPRFARDQGVLGMFPPLERERVRSLPFRWRGRWRQLKRLEWTHRKTSSMFLNDRVVDGLWPRMLQLAAGWRAMNLGAFPDDALGTHLAEVFTAAGEFREPCDVGVLFHHYDLTLLVSGLLNRWLGDEGVLYAQVTSALEGSETISEARTLWSIAQSARKNPALVELLRSQDVATLRARAPGLDGGRELLAQIDAFLETHYHRGANYKDVRWARWGDTPDLLLGSLKAYLDGAAEDPVKRYRRQRRARKQAMKDVRGRIVRSGIAGPFRAALFMWLLRYGHRYISLRDNHRFYFDHIYWELRRTYLEIGRRLVARGAMEADDDVCFLGHGEVRAAVAGKLADEEIRARVAVRKREYLAWADRPVPMFLRGNEPLDDAAGAVVPGADGAFRGLPAGAGRVTAVARVVTEVSALDRLQPGEILVAYQTDPGWTPWFSRLGGLVLETGSVLAHGASLAREYGIPAVTAVPGATQSIPDGATLTLDGAAGTVVVHATAG